jgi:hypothetical protein
MSTCKPDVLRKSTSSTATRKICNEGGDPLQDLIEVIRLMRKGVGHPTIPRWSYILEWIKAHLDQHSQSIGFTPMLYDQAV